MVFVFFSRLKDDPIGHLFLSFLKNDKKRYHSDKEGGLVRELNDYFKEILEF